MERGKIMSGGQNKDRKLFSGITKNVLALGITSFLTDFSTELYYPLLPIFLSKVIGAGTLFIGFLEGVAESTASLLKLFSGWLSDRLRLRKAIVVCGYGLSSLTRPALAVATMKWHVLMARFFDRVGKGIRTSPRDALIADSSPPDKRGKAFGFHRAMDHAGAVIGPLTAFMLMSFIGERYKTIFWLSSIPAIFSVIVLVILVKDIKRVNSNNSSPGWTTLTLKPFNRYFKLFLPIIVLFTLGNSSDAFLILKARDVGIRPEHIPLLWVALHVVKMFSSMPGGMWSDAIGRKRVIVIGWLIYSCIYLGFAFSKSATHIWLLFTLYGIYFGLTEGTEKAFVADLVAVELRGTAYGIYNFALGVSAFPSSFLMGFIWKIAGAKVAFMYGAGLAFLAMVLIGMLIPSRLPQSHE